MAEEPAPGPELRVDPEEERDSVSHVLSRGSIYTVATAAQLASGFLVLPFLTRVLDPVEYGIVTAALVTFIVLGLAVGLGIPAAISRAYFLERGPEQTRALITATFAVAVLMAAIAEVTGPLWSGLYEGIGYDGALRLAVLATIPASVLLATQNLLRAADRPAAFVVTAMLATAIAQLLGLVGATFAEAEGYIGGIAIGNTLAAITGIKLAGFGYQPLREPGMLRGHLAFGLPTVPHSVAIYVLSAGDRIVIERLEGLVAVGRYQLAYVIGSLGILLASAVNNAWAPEIFRAPDDRRWEILAETTAAIYRLAVLVAVGLALGAPAVLGVVAPASYQLDDLVSVSVIVAAAVLPFIWYLANVSVIFWLGATGVLSWATPLAAAVNVAANIALIPLIGLDGAAVATLASYCVLGLLMWRRARSLAEIPWHAQEMARDLGLGIAAIALVLVLPTAGIWLVLRLAAAVILAGVVVKMAAGSGGRAAGGGVPAGTG